MEPEVRETLRINEEQRRYYEEADGAKESAVNGFATKLWRRWVPKPAHTRGESLVAGRIPAVRSAAASERALAH